MFILKKKEWFFCIDIFLIIKKKIFVLVEWNINWEKFLVIIILVF